MFVGHVAKNRGSLRFSLPDYFTSSVEFGAIKIHPSADQHIVALSIERGAAKYPVSLYCYLVPGSQDWVKRMTFLRDDIRPLPSTYGDMFVIDLSVL